jgi:predicted DNA-binding transcriptional regulator AlpA
MRHRLQFGMRENPASDRRHGSRFPADDPANTASVAPTGPDKRAPSQSPDQANASSNGMQYAAHCHAATDEKAQDQIEPETTEHKQDSSSNDPRSLRPLGPIDGDTMRKAPRQQTKRRSDTHEPQLDPREPPQLLACLLILPSDAEPIVSLLRNLAASLPCTAPLPSVGEADYRTATADPWLKHEQAAHYLGISKSTLYQYASREKIECRKLGGRLEYLRSTLDRFKDQQIRPARRCLMQGSIIPTALGSGK